MCNNCNKQRNSRDYNNGPFEIYDIISFTENRTDEIVLPRFYRDYSLIWILEGAGDIYTDTNSFDIMGDTIYCARPGENIHFKISKPVKGFIISFARQFLDLHEKESADLINETFFNYLLTTRVIKLNDEANCRMENIAIKMLKEFNDSFEFK